MELLRYGEYYVVSMADCEYADVRRAIVLDGAVGIEGLERLSRKADKLARYIYEQKDAYAVRNSSEVFAVASFDTSKHLCLDYLYSVKKHHNVPVGVLMNYVLNFRFADKKVVFESKDVSRFKSLVKKLHRVADYYEIKEEFREFVKRYQDGFKQEDDN